MDTPSEPNNTLTVLPTSPADHAFYEVIGGQTYTMTIPVEHLIIECHGDDCDCQEGQRYTAEEWLRAHPVAPDVVGPG